VNDLSIAEVKMQYDRENPGANLENDFIINFQFPIYYNFYDIVPIRFLIYYYGISNFVSTREGI